MTTLHQIIEGSRYLYALEDNYDAEGSLGHEKATWDKAVDLLRRLRAEYPEMYLPDIGPADQGSIDLWWNGASKVPRHWNLLINVPRYGDPSYYFHAHDFKHGGMIRSVQHEFAIIRMMRGQYDPATKV